jgi:hypothetical protein
MSSQAWPSGDSVLPVMGGPVHSADSRGPGSVTPRFPELTLANIRLARRIDARTAGEFERGLSGVGWFARLGMPSPWDGGCARIFAWQHWPGPEDALVEAFALAQQDMKDRIFAGDAAAADLPALFDRVNAQVMDQARRFRAVQSGPGCVARADAVRVGSRVHGRAGRLRPGLRLAATG